MSGHIYHGPWINFDKGGVVRGATVTLSDRNGGLLTSFIATFVTLTGAQLWKIICFAIHQMRSTTQPRDALFHQQQAVWRNTNGPGGIAWVLLTQSWFWRGRARLSWIRTLSWSLFAVVYVVIFGLLAVFSSEISKSPGTQRLLMSDNNTCGYWAMNASSPFSGAALSAKTGNDSLVAATYAKACYGGSYDPLKCSRFVKPSIGYTTTQNATCPFDSKLCLWGETGAYQVVSDVIDSQTDLGINTPVHGRLGFQKKTVCSVVRQKGYAAFVTDIIDNKDGSYTNVTDVYYYYGISIDKTDPTNVLNWTDFVNINAFRDSIGYKLDTIFSWANITDNGWQPIPELFRDDSDIALMFLSSNSIRYDVPVDDPLFSAHDYNAYADVDFAWYTSDYYAGTLGCTEQYRFINPNNNQATEFYGYNQLFNKVIDVNDPANHLGWNAMQMSMMYRFIYAANWGNLYSTTYSQGAGALRASDTVFQLSQIALPNNQWQLEVDGFFENGLAALQQHVVEYATGPANVDAGARLWQPAVTNQDAGSEYMCYSQIINDSSETMSFSVLGMAILFALGGFIIFLSLILERVVGFIQQRFKFNLHGQRAWLMDDKLHLQKGVFERSGMGKWKDGADDDLVPTTFTRDEFPRFEEHQLFSPNNPDSPEGGFSQKTEYMGAHARVSEVPMYPQPHPGYHQ